jgi:hypothetical protein
MKHFVLGLTFASIALAQHPHISECFKVHEMIRADEEHYWTTWTNACPYTIDSVYVLVKFADRAAHELADGVWSLHFIAPGAHRTMRFSAPGKLADFAFVHKHKITADIGEAFGRPVTPAPPAAPASVFKEIALVSTVVMDEGEGPYRAISKAPAPDSVVSAAILKEVLTSSAIVQASTPSLLADPSGALFRTDFPDAWRAVLSPQESAVLPAPRPSFVRFVTEQKPVFQ